jgi:hypothetical protein
MAGQRVSGSGVSPGSARAGSVVPGREVREVSVGSRPTGGLRSYTGGPSSALAGRPGTAHSPGDASRPDARPPHRSGDPRYSRPSHVHVRPPHYAHTRPPVVVTYRSYYTRWYCHPWYRYQYSTWAVVGFGFTVSPWDVWWVPPSRAGWAWTPGYWSYGYWVPGYWSPVRRAPVGYVYVPGWWESEAYVEGYYRVEQRDDWEWVEGYYLDDGTFIRGHWVPAYDGPEGYVWEAGFWDGQNYVEGFWRPEYRQGFAWVGAYYDEDGVFHGGYWMPTEERPGQLWIPGWFDGNEWIDGYWVDESEVTEEAIQSWEPPEGVDDRWEQEIDPRAAPPEATLRSYQEETGEAPLALPVTPDE